MGFTAPQRAQRPFFPARRAGARNRWLQEMHEKRIILNTLQGLWAVGDRSAFSGFWLQSVKIGGASSDIFRWLAVYLLEKRHKCVFR